MMSDIIAIVCLLLVLCQDTPREQEKLAILDEPGTGKYNGVIKPARIDLELFRIRNMASGKKIVYHVSMLPPGSSVRSVIPPAIYVDTATVPTAAWGITCGNKLLC